LRGVAVPERRAVLGARAAEELPSASLDAKMRKWMALRSRGVRVNDALRESKGFRNPDFLQSAVSRFGIDERATMFSPDVFDPNEIAARKGDYYECLASAQKLAAERREKERKEKGPNRVVQFRSAAAERAGGGGGGGGGGGDPAQEGERSLMRQETTLETTSCAYDRDRYSFRVVCVYAYTHVAGVVK
jgi:hypothetical protein